MGGLEKMSEELGSIESLKEIKENLDKMKEFLPSVRFKTGEEEKLICIMLLFWDMLRQQKCCLRMVLM